MNENAPEEANRQGEPTAAKQHLAAAAHASETTGPTMPTSQPVLLRALKWGLFGTLVLLIACGAVGWLIAGSHGLYGGMLGAGIAGVFFGLTVGSIAFANRFIEHPNYLIIFFVLVAGGWLLKFVMFIVSVLLLRNQPWLDPKILFFSLVVGVVVSLVLDAFIMLKSRIPLVGNVA